jgi:hypothetical protein
MSLLELAFLVDESWEALTGMDLRTLKTNLAKISECADMIKRLNDAELIYRTAFELKDTYFAQIYQSPTLPELLLEYANKIKSLLRIQGPGHKIYLHVWKAHFVAIVVESTGKAHDLEVSSIIAAVLNTPKYSEKAHQAWRLRYAQVIENERVRLRARL